MLALWCGKNQLYMSEINVSDEFGISLNCFEVLLIDCDVLKMPLMNQFCVSTNGT